MIDEHARIKNFLNLGTVIHSWTKLSLNALTVHEVYVFFDCKQNPLQEDLIANRESLS